MYYKLNGNSYKLQGMFTGVIKLAQIDDYIAPSQNCIQPKIMKKDVKQQKATVTLNDCLACSGCITSAQSILIQQMSIKKLQQFASSQHPIYVIISPQSLLSLAKYYKMDPTQMLQHLTSFMSRHFQNFVSIFDLTLAIQIEHQLIFEQFTKHIQHKKLPLLCSQCPGWVCYAQKTLTSQITDLMSEVKSPQQIMGQIIKQKYGKSCKVVSIMPCYDKKLEAIRYQIQDKIKQVDLTLATIQIVDLIKQKQGEQVFVSSKFDKDQSTSMQLQNIQNLTFVKNQTSNGYIQFILSRLGITEYKCEQIKNSDFIEYTFQFQGVVCKMAKCYGFRNIQKVVQMAKKNKCPYLYVQIMACPGGCFGGGGQIRYEGIKNKQIIAQLQQILTHYPSIDGRTKVNIQSLQYKIENIYVKYKPIQKTMTEAVMNW